MRLRGTVLRFALRVVTRTALALTVLLGLFTSVLLIGSESVTTWSGTLTLPSTTIAAGKTVELDPSKDTAVTMTGNLIVSGVLRSKPAAGVTHTIRFTGIDESKFVGGGNVPLASDIGLWVTDAGSLDLAGAEKLAYTRAAASLAKGATTAVLEAVPSGWKAGDEILITATESPSVAGFSVHQEVRTLTSVGGSTIGFGALSFPHPRVTVKPGIAYGAEVVNLTRSVRIEGQDPTHRTHVWIKSSVPQSIRNVAIRYVGPQKGAPADTVLGRYGLHLHRGLDGARGSIVEGVVVRSTGGPAFALHQSNGVTLRNTVAYDVQGAAYWYDPGETEAPNDTLYDGALAAFIRPTPKDGAGHRLTAFMLGRGIGNSCLRCIATGVQGGKNASGFAWPEAEIGIWKFEDALAHNNARDGIFVWQNGTRGHVVDRFTAYHNGSAGIEHGAYTNEYHYRNNILYGNKTAGVILHATSLESPPPTTFEQPYVDGAGLGANAVLLAKPMNTGQPPTVWCAASITSLIGVPFKVNYSGLDASVAKRLLILTTCPASYPPPNVGLPPASKTPTKGTKSSSKVPGAPIPSTPPPSTTPSPGRGGTPPKQGR